MFAQQFTFWIDKLVGRRTCQIVGRDDAARIAHTFARNSVATGIGTDDDVAFETKGAVLAIGVANPHRADERVPVEMNSIRQSILIHLHRNLIGAAADHSIESNFTGNVPATGGMHVAKQTGPHFRVAEEFAVADLEARDIRLQVRANPRIAEAAVCAASTV